MLQRDAVNRSRPRNDRYFRALVERSSEMTVVIGADGRIEYVSSAVQRILGYPSQWRRITDAFELVHPDDQDRVLADFRAKLVDPDGGEPITFRVRHCDGTWRHVEAVGANLRDDPDVAAIVVNMREVGARVEAEQRLDRARRDLQQQATHDPLTGLPNRVLLEARVRQAQATYERTGRPYAVVFVDLDRFKVLNDGLGHAAGDELLREVARRLRRVARPSDTVARFGGDEFVLLLEDLPRDADVDAIAARFAAAIAPVFRIGRHEVRVGVSGGIVVVDGDADGRDVLSEADAAMYLAKRRGRGRFERFGPEMRREAAERLAVEEDLHRAVDHGELVAYFQTEVDLVTGAVVGAEALCRWQHPERGLVGPGAFVRVLEEIGLAHRLGDTMRDQALALLAAWRRGGALTDGWVSVNVAAAELLRPDFACRVVEDLERHGVEGSALCLEITESSLVADLETAVGALAELRRHGVTFAIDDFGTGYASLAYLRRFTPDFVKIDRTFVTGMLHDPGELAIVRAAVDMAHAFGARAVAEGVELTEHRDALRELGCDLGQGYLYSRPLPASRVEPGGASAA